MEPKRLKNGLFIVRKEATKIVVVESIVSLLNYNLFSSFLNARGSFGGDNLRSIISISHDLTYTLISSYINEINDLSILLEMEDFPNEF